MLLYLNTAQPPLSALELFQNNVALELRLVSPIAGNSVGVELSQDTY